MSARYQIFHDTHYHYDSPVSLAQQLAHLWPRPCAWQRCTWQQLDISPQPSSRRDELDVFGNPITRLAFERPHDELLVNAGLTVEVLARPSLDFQQSPPWDQIGDSLTYSSQALSPEQLEEGYFRLKRDFSSCSSILRRSLGLRGVLKRIAYNVAWMKIDPLWVAIIRSGLMPFATRIFERILQLNTKTPGREHGVMPNPLNALAGAPFHATKVLAIDNCQQPGPTFIAARTPDCEDSESAFARLPAESGQTHQTNSR